MINITQVYMNLEVVDHFLNNIDHQNLHNLLIGQIKKLFLLANYPDLPIINNLT